MHGSFNIGSSVVGGIFLYLIELDRKIGASGNPQSLLAIILSILTDRAHLARVCREWLELLSDTQTLTLASLHFNAFGCRGSAIELFARYKALQSCHFVHRNLEAFLCEPIIANFLSLPWCVRVAKLDIYYQKSDTFRQEIFEKELIRVQNFFSPQTIALVKRAIAESPSPFGTLTSWLSTTQQRSQQTVYMQYELLNLRSGHQLEVVPDEFVASFKNINVHSCWNLPYEHGTRWAVKVTVQLTSVLCIAAQDDEEVNGTCMFTFRNRSFGAIMRVSLGSRLKLTLDFVTIPNL